jgi:arylsulfatase
MTPQSVNNANWFTYEFWRFVLVQEVVAKFAQSFIDFPPLQPPASFNMDAIKAQVSKAIQAHHGA